MSHLEPSTSLQSTEKCKSQRRRYASTFPFHAHQLVVTWPTCNSPHTASIDILDDGLLLNIFCLYRPFLPGEDDGTRVVQGNWGWGRGHWWFKLSHVCQRWRSLIHASSSHLDLYLVCTKGTPVAEMLAHSPPLPLVVDYYKEDSIMNTEDEEGLILALEQRDRVRRIRLRIYMPNSQRLIRAISEEYPILEFLVIVSPDTPQGLALPETLQAPHLHHLVLSGVALPIGCRLITTAVGLVTLVLVIRRPSTYVHPNALLQWISFTPRLETLGIHFFFAFPSHIVERQPTLMPMITTITLPNLRMFWFRGIDAYFEAIVCKMATPRLTKIQFFFFKQPTFSVPHLSQFMNTILAENLRFSYAWFAFSTNFVDVFMLPHYVPSLSRSLRIRVFCPHFGLQVSAMAQISNLLSQISSTVEHLTLSYEAHSQPSDEHNEVEHAEWRRIPSSFSNVKILRIEDGPNKEIARCLRLDDGELLPLDLLPELLEFTYSRSSDSDN